MPRSALTLLAVGVMAACAVDATDSHSHGDKHSDNHRDDERVDTSAWRAQLARWTYPAPLPQFPLEDADGRAFALPVDEPVLLAFAFSRCATAEACPATLARLRDVARAATRSTSASGGELESTGDVDLGPARPPRIVVVTLDPEHDRGEVLRAWATRERLDGARATFVRAWRGERDVTDALASCFNAGARGEAPALAHPVKAALLIGRAPRAVWTDNAFTADDVVEALGAPRAPETRARETRAPGTRARSAGAPP